MKFLLTLILLLIFTGKASSPSPYPPWAEPRGEASSHSPYPTIFIHGIGDSSVVWKKTGPLISAYYDGYYKTSEHPHFMAGSGIGKDGKDQDFSDNLRNSCVYITFKDHFASPADQVEELAKVIEETREEVWKYFGKEFGTKENIRVNLVAFSQGGLVARKYLVNHHLNPASVETSAGRHHVNKLLMVCTPNKGSRGLNFVPPLPIELRGVKWDSPAAQAMKEGSVFLRDLNSHPLPEDVEYISIVSNTTYLPHFLINKILFFNGGDGAISVDSQRLSQSGIPNVDKLNYQEFYINSPHFQGADRAGEMMIRALGF